MKRILIVDDSRVAREFLKSHLENSQFEVDIANDGIHALERLLDFHPDLIISDVEMERLGGFHLVRILRQSLKINIPIILVSGVWNNKLGFYLKKRLGNITLLKKPVEVEKLNQLIAEIMGSKISTQYELPDNFDFISILSNYSQYLEEIYNQQLILREIERLSQFTNRLDEYVNALNEILQTFLICNSLIVFLRIGRENIFYRSRRFPKNKSMIRILKWFKKSDNMHEKELVSFPLSEDEKMALNIQSSFSGTFSFNNKLEGSLRFKIFLEYAEDPFSNFFLEILQQKLNEYCQILLLNEQSRLHGITDFLTNSYNRKHMIDVLIREDERFQRKQTNYAISMLDIDHFKKINDQYGHQTGDRVLQQVANLIWHHIRRYDLLFRVGGEEFIILFPDCGLSDGLVITERIRELIAEYNFNPFVRSVTVSQGVVDRLSMPDVTIDQLINIADTFLYKAKEEGRNQVRYLTGRVK